MAKQAIIIKKRIKKKKGKYPPPKMIRVIGGQVDNLDLEAFRNSRKQRIKVIKKR